MLVGCRPTDVLERTALAAEAASWMRNCEHGHSPESIDSSSCSWPPSRECPVKNLTLVARPRWVSGTPMSAQMPDAAVMPVQK